MQPHPIPQNVTSFQFHLVGDMTLKQFLYLAIGCTIAYLIFIFAAAKYPLISWPLIIISAGLGVAFAFLPFGSRPLDYWLAAFLKAIYSPTKRVWKKNNKSYKEEPLFGSRFIMFLTGTPSPQPTSTLPQPPMPIPPISQPVPAAPPPPPDLLSKDDLGKTVDLAKEAQNLQFKIIQTERALSQIKQASSQPSAQPVDYTAQINKIMTDLQTLVNQSSHVQTQLDKVTKQEPPPVAAISPAALKEKIKVIVPEKPKQTQLALTTFPNVLNGIVKDKSGNYLEGVVAVIYDKDGLPVRALKTNKLGQFTGSTPLPNGTYTLETEKDTFTFDVLQIELTGEVLPPLLITPK